MFSIFKKATKLQITDDSGFLAVANPDKYNSFVDENWELPQLVSRFTDEMNKETLIIWATGSSGEWTVSFAEKPSGTKSFQEFNKTIVVTNGQLCLTNYEDLTMAAQFADDKIPADHNADLTIKLDNGRYNLTVRQMFNPEDHEYDPEGKVNFEIVIQADNKQTEKVNKIYWWTE